MAKRRCKSWFHHGLDLSLHRFQVIRLCRDCRKAIQTVAHTNSISRAIQVAKEEIDGAVVDSPRSLRMVE